jgi:hypothetical protein
VFKPATVIKRAPRMAPLAKISALALKAHGVDQRRPSREQGDAAPYSRRCRVLTAQVAELENPSGMLDRNTAIQSQG